MIDKLFPRPIRKYLKEGFFLLNGALIAYWLNYYFSFTFASLFYQPLLLYPLLLWIVWVDAIIWSFKGFNRYMKFRAILLGASMTSVISAFLTFVSVAYSGSINLDTIFISIFRSILFASLFSFMERLVRFLEDQKTP